MENPDANQLPEVDSLPDGFVDSPTEHLAPPTPTLEQGKPPSACKEDSISELDHLNLTIPELTANEPQTSQSEKLRTLPVPLSEIDGFDTSVHSVEVPSKGCAEQAEGTMAIPGSANLVSDASVGVSGCSEVNQQVQGNCQSSDRCNYLLFECIFPVLPFALEFLMLDYSPLVVNLQPFKEGQMHKLCMQKKYLHQRALSYRKAEN